MLRTLLLTAALSIGGVLLPAAGAQHVEAAGSDAGGGGTAATDVDAAAGTCPDNAGITLPPGFCATVFADHVGHARQMTVSPDGVVYVNTWSGKYYPGKPPVGGFLVALKDTTGDGKADEIERFGPTPADGGKGGTGIALYKGYVYAEAGDKIVRYKLPKDGIAPAGSPETVISGLPVSGDHPMHGFTIDSEGNLFVEMGSATNACQKENRVARSPGETPCTELKTRAGIWRYDANKTDQAFSPDQRYATGIRNAEGIAILPGVGLFATQHGRDELQDNWPDLYTPKQGATEPAEELLKIEQDDDYGWPECYFDNVQKKLVLAPEYGGDGGHKVGVCADKLGPVASFPAHWAPNALVFYTGDNFPTAYQGGAFIAFHGSWNRAPFPQGGYNVVFQPMQDGKANGAYAVFADGFAGKVKDQRRAAHRPSGLAAGPDGALYISDDWNGRIWRVTYTGDRSVGVQAAAAAPAGGSEAGPSAAAAPPEGENPNAGKIDLNALPLPHHATRAQIMLGAKVFAGEAGGAGCTGCHGADAKGTSRGPDLTDDRWLWGDGTPGAIRRVVVTGVPKPKHYSGAMPAKGGGDLTKAEMTAVADYVWALSHQQ